jgi:hypothetical protein
LGVFFIPIPFPFSWIIFIKSTSIHHFHCWVVGFSFFDVGQTTIFCCPKKRTARSSCQ